MSRRKLEPAESFRVLVRHANAGLRSEWLGSDEWRALTDVGHAQATAVARMLGDLQIVQILSSPSLRCRQTVVPLALVSGLDVEPCWALGSQVEVDTVLGLLADPATVSSVLCTHRETLQSLFGRIAGGSVVAGSENPMDMGAAWIVRGSVTDPDGARCEYLGSGAELLQRAVAAAR